LMMRLLNMGVAGAIIAISVRGHQKKWCEGVHWARDVCCF
jgi:hypothetical protein